MTTETFTPAPKYTIDGIGPYNVPHAYSAATDILAVVEVDGVLVDVAVADISLVPEQSESAGDVWLDATYAAANDGLDMYILRATFLEQGWVGVGGSREKGLEIQLDRLTRRIQDAAQGADTSLRVVGKTVKPYVPTDQAVPIWDEIYGGFVNGPFSADVAGAQGYAADAATSETNAAASAASVQPYADRATAEATTQLAVITKIAVFADNGYVLEYSRDATGTALTTNGGAVKWSPTDRVANVLHWGAGRAVVGDDNAAVTAAITWALNNDNGVAKVKVPSGYYRFSDTLRLDPALIGETDSIEGLIFEGEGSRNSVASVFHFDFADAAKNGLEIISGFQIYFRDMGITGDGARLNLVSVDALNAPGFSGHVVVFQNCYIRNFNATPAGAVVEAKNSKLIRFDNTYIGIETVGDTSIMLGGNEVDNASTHMIGKLSMAIIENCYIWGIVKYKNVGELQFVGNQFVDDGGLHGTGDGRINNALIAYNSVAEDGPSSVIAVDLTASAYASGRVGSGAIRIENNRFRNKLKAVRIDGSGPIHIEHNSWELTEAGTVGIEILATADPGAVTIGPQYDFDLTSKGYKVVDDKRSVFATDEPFDMAANGLIISEFLAADDTSISANNTAQVVMTTAAAKLRGGFYHIDCSVTVRCTDAVDDLPFMVLLRLSQSGGDTNLGLVGHGVAPVTTKVSAGTYAVATVHLSSVVYLPPSVVSGTASDKFKLIVRNTGSGTPATGHVEGNATLLVDTPAAYIQVRNIDGGPN